MKIPLLDTSGKTPGFSRGMKASTRQKSFAGPILDVV